jgi:hypothetical protein
MCVVSEGYVQFHDEVELLWSVEKLFQENNVRMPHFLEDTNFVLQPRGVHLVFFDDFDSELLFGGLMGCQIYS